MKLPSLHELRFLSCLRACKGMRNPEQEIDAIRNESAEMKVQIERLESALDVVSGGVPFIPELHDVRFLSGEFFLRAYRKYGRVDQLLKLATSASRLVVTIHAILLGDRSKDRETELIERIAEVEIYLSSIVTAFGFQSDA